MRTNMLRAMIAVLAVLSITRAATAEVGLRIDARPLSKPIEAYIAAMPDGGELLQLAADEIEIRLDGAPIRQFELTSSPRHDPRQRISVVLIARHPIRFPPGNAQLYSAFIKRLEPGDHAAVVLLGYGTSIDARRIYQISVLQFMEIDGGGNSGAIVDFLETGQSNLATVTPADFFFMSRGIDRALDEFTRESTRLPNGPRAIVSWDAATNHLSEVVSRANHEGVSFFTRDLTARRLAFASREGQRALTDNTGGVVVELLPGTGPALPVVESWLKDGYRLTIPAQAADDCDLHMLEVTVRGQATGTSFSRCDAIPEPLEFTQQHGVRRGSVVVSEARRVRGIASPAPVSVHSGEYSIGCGRTFTSAPGYVQPGQAICVRHEAATRPGKETQTRLVIGGVLSTFESYAAL